MRPPEFLYVDQGRIFRADSLSKRRRMMTKKFQNRLSKPVVKSERLNYIMHQGGARTCKKLMEWIIRVPISTVY